MYILALVSMKRFEWEGEVAPVSGEDESFEVTAVLDAINKPRPHANYTNIVIYKIDPSRHERKWLLNQMANTVQSIAFLRRSGVNEEHCAFVEKLFYTNLPEKLKAFLRSVARQTWRDLRHHIATVCWDPDHVWRTGSNAGLTTLQIMQREWDQHILEQSS